MGGGITVNSPYEKRHIEFSVISDVPVERIEIVRNSRCSHISYYSDGNRGCVSGEWVDDSLVLPGSYYYLRVICADKQMAWSSPVWISVPL